MQFKTFTIPIGDSGAATEELNRFLRGQKVLEVEKHFMHNDQGATWCFCVKYIETNTTTTATNSTNTKPDYKMLLDETAFAVFSKLRESRKKIAVEEALPAFAIFTDEELSNIAQLKPPSPTAMRGIKGIGEKKVERYAERLLAVLSSQDTTPITPTDTTI